MTSVPSEGEKIEMKTLCEIKSATGYYCQKNVKFLEKQQNSNTLEVKICS